LIRALKIESVSKQHYLDYITMHFVECSQTAGIRGMGAFLF